MRGPYAGHMLKRSFWGWGWEGEGPSPERLALVEAGLTQFLGVKNTDPSPPPKIEDIALSAPRIQAPPSLAGLTSQEPYDRAGHCYGKSYRDLARALDRNFENPPDLVAFPRSEGDVVALLDWCHDNQIAAIPYGGGSTVCAGVEARLEGKHEYRGALSLDLTGLNQVVEVDKQSRAARIQGGALGPQLEDQLRPHGLTLRHFPQSFEFSTLGGWIATRSGGHYATLYTHIDELVEGLRVVTPKGTLETRRLPGSGAGPSPDRMFIGSEGILGVITEAWMRLQERPRLKAQATARFDSFGDAMKALRALTQSGLHPTNCRVLDPFEALLNQADGSQQALLLLGFEASEGADLQRARMAHAISLCRDHQGMVKDDAVRYREQSNDERDAAQATWRDSFIKAPYLRDALALRGVFAETFETAVTWDRFDELHTAVTEAARKACEETGGAGIVTCRITHAYPDGAAPYFTVVAPALKGDELRQWDVIKAAITDAMLAHGGTTTHHHAVGRDFRPWYDRQRPELFASALRAAKAELDPNGVLNPGVLLTP